MLLLVFPIRVRSHDMQTSYSCMGRLADCVNDRLKQLCHPDQHISSAHKLIYRPFMSGT